MKAELIKIAANEKAGIHIHHSAENPSLTLYIVGPGTVSIVECVPSS